MKVLVNKKDTYMFFEPKIVEVKVQDNELVNALREDIARLNRDIKNLKEDHAREIKNLNSDIDLRIKLATQSLIEEKNKALADKAVLQEKVNFIERAFTNMGFDVKDMKDILNKLADAVIAKNQVHIVK